MRTRGFTLIEVATVLGAAAMLAAVAVPTMHGRLVAARRGDATVALERVQAAQERLRTRTGLYSDDPATLGVALRSPEGLYELSLSLGPDERFVVVARPVAGGLQEEDAECAEITLEVVQGFATPGPSRRCWNR